MRKIVKLPSALALLLLNLLLLASFSVSAVPTITFTYLDEPSDNITVAEKIGLVQIVATLSEVQTTDVSFDFGFIGGTVTEFKDISFPSEVTGDISGTAKSGRVTIAPGLTTQSFYLVNILDDILDEEDETLIFGIAGVQGAILGQSGINITVIDDEIKPTIRLVSETLTRNGDGSYSAAINESEAGVDLKLALVDDSNRSSYDIAISYSIIQSEGVDPLNPDYSDPGFDTYPHQQGKLIMLAETIEKAFQFSIQPDDFLESQEVITFKLTSADHAHIHETRNTIEITINDDDANAGAINDTGVTTCYDANANPIPCGSSDGGFPVTDQDGSLGQASAGRYTKLDETGQVQSSTFNNPTCIYDENTNLIWQVAKNANTFSWFNKINRVNGGSEGSEGVKGEQVLTCDQDNSPCNTDHYADVLNRKGLCNIDQWRLPKLRELMSIMDFEPDNQSVLINEPYFTVSRLDVPGTRPVFYWTSTPSAVNKDEAWCVFFGKEQDHHVQLCNKASPKLVRMVATCNSNSPNSPCR